MMNMVYNTLYYNIISSFIHRNIMLMKREIIISFLASSLMKKMMKRYLSV